MWPQYAFLGLLCFSAGVQLIKHGDEHPDYNFFMFCISVAIEMWLLIAGGFFKGVF